MLMKFGSMLLVLLMINLTGVSLAFARSKNMPNSPAMVAKKGDKKAAKVKKGVEQLGVGKDSVVEVKLRDKTIITGYISEIRDDGFTITDAYGESTAIEYSNAKQIKGNNLSSGVWIAVGFGLAMLTFAIVIFAIKGKN